MINKAPAFLTQYSCSDELHAMCSTGGVCCRDFGDEERFRLEYQFIWLTE